MVSLVNNTKYLRKKQYQFYAISSKKQQREEHFLVHSMKSALTRQRHYKKTADQFLILTQTQKSSTNINNLNDDQVRFILDMQGSFNIHKSINVICINRLNKKNYMIILTDAEKALHKIRQPFMRKTLISLPPPRPPKKLGIEGNFFYLIQDIYQNPKDDIIVNGERLKIFPLR